MDPKAQQAQKAPVAPKSQPSSTKQRRASQAEQPTASTWSNGDFEWPESVNPGVRFTENGWPLFEEHGSGTWVTVKTQTGFNVDVFCTKNNQTVSALYKQWEGRSCVQKAVVLSYVQESQKAFLHLKASTKFDADTLVPFPRRYDKSMAEQAELLSKPNPAKKRKAPDDASDLTRGAPVGSGLGAVSATNVLGDIAGNTRVLRSRQH